MRIADFLLEASFDHGELKRRYDHYNKLLFDGQLPDIPIEYAKLKAVGGKVDAKVRTTHPTTRAMLRFAKRELVPGSMRLQISTLYQRAPEQMDGILIHEMIHVHFLSIGDFTEQHGIKFQVMARQLGAKVGFAIPLTDKVDGLQLTDAPKRKVGVVILTKKTGAQSVAVVSNAYVREHLAALVERWSYGVKHNYAAAVDIVVAVTPLESRYPIQRKAVRDLSYFIIKDPALIQTTMQDAEVLAHIP